MEPIEMVVEELVTRFGKHPAEIRAVRETCGDNALLDTLMILRSHRLAGLTREPRTPRLKPSELRDLAAKLRIFAGMVRADQGSFSTDAEAVLDLATEVQGAAR